MQWYIHFQGQKEGPFSPEEFRQKLANLASRDQVFVWRTGMDGWKKVQDVPEIALMNAQPSADAAKPGQQDLSVLMEMPNLVDEKTRVLDTGKIKALAKEAKQAEKVANKARAQAKTDVAEAPSEVEGKRGSGLVKKIGFVLIAAALVGGGIFAYPQFAKPHLPPIADLGSVEYQKLQDVVAIPADQGVHVDFSLSTSDVAHPKFYLVSNQKDIHLAVIFEPVSGTFPQKPPQPITMNASEMKNHFATTDRMEVSEGEYIVKVFEVGQPQKIFTEARFFLGGVKNAAYTEAMTQYHAQRKTQAEAELRDLNESAAQLDGFLEILQDVKRDPKTFVANQVKWDDMEKGFAAHSILLRPDATEESAVLSSLLHEAREVWKQFKALNDLQKSEAVPGANVAQINPQIDAAFTQALAAMTAFKASLVKTNPSEIQ
jgi:hypothetical protein